MYRIFFHGELNVMIMVKIFQTYNFAKQNTNSLSGEIVSATLIDSKHIAVSSADHFIEIYDIEERPRDDYGKNSQDENTEKHYGSSSSEDERLPVKQYMATVGGVLNLMYCEAGKYLITLEKESLCSPVRNNSSGISCAGNSNNTVFSEEDTKMFVRIYANFSTFPPNVKLKDLPITIRIASMTTPKSFFKSIDVIELPLRSPPDIMQCCQISGNIIVSSKERIYLYEYTQCVHESTQLRFQYIDFLPFKFFVNLNFIPLKLNVAENVIACMSNRYCVVFRIVDVLTSNACTIGDDSAIPSGIVNPDIHDEYYNAERKNVHANANGVNDPIALSDSSSNSKTSAVLCHSSHTHNNFESDSLGITPNNGCINNNGRINGCTPIDFNLARMVNSACGYEFEVHLKSQWDNMNGDYNEGGSTIGGCGAVSTGTAGNYCGKSMDSHEITINPTKANEIKIKLVNEAKSMNVQRVSTNGKLIAAYNEDNMIQYDVRKLLQICMKTNEIGGSVGGSSGGRIMDILRCMDLKALYQRHDRGTDELHDSEYEMGNQQIPGTITTLKHINRRTLKSAKHQSCIGFALIVTSSVDGYLYLFCAKGKWFNENEKPLAIYSFTAPILYVHINDYVIHAVTTESVETHTSRLGHKLFSNRYEYSALAEQYPEESSPDVNDPITVLSLAPFVNVQCVCANRHYLVVISSSSSNSIGNTKNNNPHYRAHLENNTVNTLMKRKSANNTSDNSTGNEKRNIAARIIAEARTKHTLLRLNSSSQQSAYSTINNEWTLYNFQIPQVEDIVDDLDALAQTFRYTSPTQFYDLMQEAHVMLRLSMSLQFEQLEPDREMKLYKKFIENCHKLADFVIRSSKKEIYLQATGFYKMCDLQLSDIYSNYVKNINTTAEMNIVQGQEQCKEQQKQPPQKEQLAGLIYCVKEFLSHFRVQRLKASFLKQSVTPCFTAKHFLKQGYHNIPLALEFLHLFIKYSPKDLPQIMLNSPVVADCISGEIINYLKSLEKLTPEENLLFAVTACRMSNYLLSHEIINRTTRYDLAIALIKYKNVLFDDSTQLIQGHYKGVSLKSRNIALENLSKNDKRMYGCNNDTTSAAHMNCDITSFSDFTETILLAIENDDLIEAISDVFIHAVCVEHSLTLDIALQLFLNFLASHIGQKGYQTSQKVFANILQVYYYDYFDVLPWEGTGELVSLITPQMDTNFDNNIDENISISKSTSIEHDSESLVYCNSDSLSISSLSATMPHLGREEHIITNDRIVYDQLQEQDSPYKHHSNMLARHTLGGANIDCGNGVAAGGDGVNDRINNESHTKGLKILFRMLMGRLKELSDIINDLQSADIEQQSMNGNFMSLRMECINFMGRHLQDMRKGQHKQQQQSQMYYAKITAGAASATAITTSKQRFFFVPYLPDYKTQDNESFEKYIKTYKRPIPCLMERPQYLNRLPPFQRNDFTYPNTVEDDTAVHFIGWRNELLTLTLKIQSLLASSKIDREIIEEFIAFVQKTPDLIGINSFLIIILPKHLAINYMINFYPEYLWHYGKSNNFTPKQWESLLNKLIHKKNALPNWKQHVTEILDNLIIDLSYEELLQCFPFGVLQNRNSAIWTKELITECHMTLASYSNKIMKSDAKECDEDVLNHRTINLSRNHVPMDNVDENNVFELMLRKAIVKQRGIALRSMIESTGKQLFDASNNPMYNL